MFLPAKFIKFWINLVYKVKLLKDDEEMTALKIIYTFFTAWICTKLTWKFIN
jgi:hypothetical protein